MVTTEKTLTTAAQLAALPDDGNRYELLEGELLTMPPASDGQGVVVGEIVGLLRAADPKHEVGRVLAADVGYKLAADPDTVLAPDISFILKARVRPIEKRRGFPPGAPDLAIEVLSPSNSAAEMARKVDYYLRTGSTLVWLVDPETRSIIVYERGQQPRLLKADDEIDGGPILPRFRHRVGDFFD